MDSAGQGQLCPALEAEMRYIVRRAYESHVGKYAVGQVLELDDETAAWLLRDMPGVIEAARPAVTPPAAPPIVEMTMIETPGADVEVHVARPARKGRGRK